MHPFRSFIRFSVVCGLALGLSAPAFAHAKLVSSTPAEGASVAQMPEEAVLTFSTAVRPTFCRLLGADGKEVATIDAVHMEGMVMHVLLPKGLGAGVYTLSYGVVSEDAHPIKGTMTFTVTATP